jgi:hypothetical protein
MFHNSYIDARAAFKDAARDGGFLLESYELEGVRGSNGEALTIDVAIKGSGNQLVLTSGLHGVEGYTGSACQIQNIRQLVDVPCKLVFIHGVNPYGFSLNSRTNENRIDLNRNCGPAYPRDYNPEYEVVHKALLGWMNGTKNPTFENAREVLVELRHTMGEERFSFAVTSGQFRHPDGLFFGGYKRETSLIILEEILKRHCSETAPKTLTIDYHTGLGPSGYGEIIFMGNTKHPSRQLAERWLSDVRCPASGDSASNAVKGSAENFFIRPEFGKEVSHVALEFGTVPLLEVLAGLCCDLWIRNTPSADAAIAEKMRLATRKAFLGTTPEWQAAVLTRSKEVMDQALSSLA